MLATESEAEQEYVLNVGFDAKESAWILSPRDVWYPNPYYTGEPKPHPGDIDYEILYRSILCR